ncbi:MAG TPA: hypothetical protein VKF63_00760 [Terracidiphilus sp.]|nr:hypothetical protein [Terracidiphilus sp.]
MMRSVVPALFLLVSIVAAAPPGSAQSNPRLQTFFRENIGLSQDQIDDIRIGTPVVMALPPRSPEEVFLFGAVYIHAAPESYLQLVLDFNRLRRLPNYQALGVFGNPPRLADLNGFSLDSADIRDLQKCRPGDCLIQLPGSTIEELHRSIDWSAPNLSDQVDQFLQSKALLHLLAYQHEGNQALGVYNDKRDPTEVAQQFAYMLSYDTALPAYLPDFYRYLLAYPNAKPANVEDRFYWANVKFGLKPTLRVIHLVTMRGSPASDVAYAIAEKQLYSSHYFETALDLSFCVRDQDDPKHPGFYLIMALGSEQSALAGFRGEIIKRVAVSRSVSDLQAALTNIRNTLEGDRKP